MLLIICSIALVLISHWVYRWRNPKCTGVLPPGSMGLPLIGESIEFFTPSSFEAFPPFFAKRMSRWRNPKCSGILPPGSMGFPIIGESIEFFTPTSFESFPPFFAKRMSRYGPLFRTSLVGQRVVVSTDAEINYRVFQEEGKDFQCWYTASGLELTGQEGLTAFKGEMHKYLKNLILSLIGPANLKDEMLPKMDQNTIKNLESWSTRGVLDVKESVEKMMFILAAKTLLACSEETALQLRMNYMSFTGGLISFPLNFPGTAFRAALKGREKALEVINNAMKQRQSSKENEPSFLNLLCDEIERKESALTEKIAVELLFIVLFASYETTSSAITLALKFLKGSPDVLEKLAEEHEEILKNRKDKELTLSWEEYKGMTFTHMVINETVRLANIVPGILRKVLEDVEIKGYTIPAGWTIMVCPPAVHLDPTTYEDPYKFNPWRWTGQELHAGSKKFMAFGGGTRLCTGADFAKLQMAIFLHHLVTKYRWEVVKEGKIMRTPGLIYDRGLSAQFWKKESVA